MVAMGLSGGRSGKFRDVRRRDHTPRQEQIGLRCCDVRDFGRNGFERQAAGQQQHAEAEQQAAEHAAGRQQLLARPQRSGACIGRIDSRQQTGGDGAGLSGAGVDELLIRLLGLP